MLYNNICRSPPITERPATASLTPKEAAAALLVEEAPLPDEVLVAEPTPLLGLEAVVQV